MSGISAGRDRGRRGHFLLRNDVKEKEEIIVGNGFGKVN